MTSKDPSQSFRTAKEQSNSLFDAPSAIAAPLLGLMKPGAGRTGRSVEADERLADCPIVLEIRPQPLVGSLPAQPSDEDFARLTFVAHSAGARRWRLSNSQLSLCPAPSGRAALPLARKSPKSTLGRLEAILGKPAPTDCATNKPVLPWLRS